MNNCIIQLVLKPCSISVSMAVFENVLTTKTFEGSDCYVQLIQFLDEQLGMDSPVQATITVSK
jgi:hypothetical protein